MNFVLVVVSLLVASCSGDKHGVGDCSCGSEQITKGCQEECRQKIDRHARSGDCNQYLASDSCDASSTYPSSWCVDKWYFEFVGGAIDHSSCTGSVDKCHGNDCCTMSSCHLPDNYTAPSSGYISKAENVTLIWYNTPDDEIDNLVITWVQPQPDNIGGYQLLISTTKSSEYDSFFQHIDRCICMPASTRLYNVLVGQSTDGYIQVKLASLPYSSVGLWKDQSRTVTKIEKVPENCWELTHIPATCVLVPGPPRNVTINSRTYNSSSVILTVTWRPPEQYYPDILGYKIHIDDLPAVTVNGTTLEYSTIINISSIYEVAIQATNTQEQSSCGFEFYYEESCIGEVCGSYCWGPLYDRVLNYTAPSNHNNTNTTTTTVSPVKTNDKHRTVLVASLSATGVPLLLIVGAIVVILTVKGCLQHRRSSVYIPMMSSPSPPPSPISDRPMKVFVVNSPQSSDEDLRLIRNLCHNLSNHAIDPISFEYSEFESGPGQVGIYQWTEEQFTNCDMIVFVCNKSLYDAWSGSESEQDAFVSASRQLLQGHFSRGENVSKFAIALLQQSDSQYIPSLYLQNISTFTVFSDGHCDEEDLVRFIKQLPHFVRPQVRSVVETVLIEQVV